MLVSGLCISLVGWDCHCAESCKVVSFDIHLLGGCRLSKEHLSIVFSVWCPLFGWCPSKAAPWLLVAAPSPVGRGQCIPQGHLFSPQPSEVNTDTEEYESQNSTETDLEFEEHEGAIMLKESLDLQVSGQQIQSWGGLAILGWKDTSVLPPAAAERGFWHMFMESLTGVLCCPSMELQSDLFPLSAVE